VTGSQNPGLPSDDAKGTLQMQSPIFPARYPEA
jgi:hypothetical protein